MIEQIELIVERAQPTDHEGLTEISFTAKRHWNYPENYFQIWKDELTISSDYICKNTVFNAVLNGIVVGFYSLVENPQDFYSGEVFVSKGFWLEHIFILPEFHHRGIGRFMIEHAKNTALKIGASCLLVFSDPYAKGFYERMGARFLYDSKSSIPDRSIPVFEIAVG
jgi:GNAT superfamily N-acetyltransferase